MQLDEIPMDDAALSTAEPVEVPRPRLTPLTVRAFGQKLVLSVTTDLYLRDDSYWRLRAIYEPALAAQSLSHQGVAVDAGAGYGCFALPFAAAFPGWTVWAFEPEPEAFSALVENIQSHGLSNVIAVNAAVVGDLPDTEAGADHAALGAALTDLASKGANDPESMAALQALLPSRKFRRHLEMRGIVEALDTLSPDFEQSTYPSLPSSALRVLAPTLLKLTTPFTENGVLRGLQDVALDHVIGESWTHLDTDLVYGTVNGAWQTWIPRAGDPLLRLRRSKPMTGHRPGLDVVVAMYNSRGWIQECVDGILEGGSPHIRALVVDDGSTDGSGDLVRDLYQGNDRVVLLPKLNGGCASARNYGRMNSDASHLAFVDADDVPGPGLFTGLLELARHTGAEIVQGGFDLLHMQEDGTVRREASYEGGIPEFIKARRHNFGERSCFQMPAWLLMQGQPTIWRRVYRRDFLDNRNIWFPEHIRAFDDQIFQILTLQNIVDVAMLEGVTYGYRQHPGQDIKQGDERSFYSLEMYRMVLKRGVSEGWNEFRYILQSYVNTVNWCWQGLRPDLRPAFVRGAAELWVYARNTLGPKVFADLSDDSFAPPDFNHYIRSFQDKLQTLDRSYGNVYLDSVDMHVSMVAQSRRPG